MHLSQSVVLLQGRVGIKKIALFGKRPRQYYGKNSSNKQRETTGHHYFKKSSSVNMENVAELPLLKRTSSFESPASEISN
jgi:hypothetical protein